jgi:glycosyltransferase involved in cell wall biosynthesis
LLTAADPAGFAAAILRLLADVPLRQALGKAGRRYVEANHDWDQLVAQLEGAYWQAAEPAQAT